MLSAGAAMAGGIDGVWRTEHGWQVKLYKCGGSYCGTVVGGTSARDVHNPKPALRKRKMVGVRMIWGMRKSGSSYKGKLYNPNDGKIYSGYLKPLSARAIKLSGCILGGLICKGQTWTRIR